MSNLTNENLESQWTHFLQDRLLRHNKDLRLICEDGGLQIDPSLLMSFMKDRTSFLGHALLMGHNCAVVQTIILPNIYIQELYQLMALLHKVIHNKFKESIK